MKYGAPVRGQVPRPYSGYHQHINPMNYISLCIELHGTICHIFSCHAGHASRYYLKMGQ